MVILPKNILSAAGTPLQGPRRGACEKYTKPCVIFTQWHGSCYMNKHMSTTK